MLVIPVAALLGVSLGALVFAVTGHEIVVGIMFMAVLALTLWRLVRMGVHLEGNTVHVRNLLSSHSLDVESASVVLSSKRYWISATPLPILVLRTRTSALSMEATARFSEKARVRLADLFGSVFDHDKHLAGYRDY